MRKRSEVSTLLSLSLVPCGSKLMIIQEDGHLDLGSQLDSSALSRLARPSPCPTLVYLSLPRLVACSRSSRWRKSMQYRLPKVVEQRLSLFLSLSPSQLPSLSPAVQMQRRLPARQRRNELDKDDTAHLFSAVPLPSPSLLFRPPQEPPSPPSLPPPPSIAPLPPRLSSAHRLWTAPTRR